MLLQKRCKLGLEDRKLGDGWPAMHYSERIRVWVTKIAHNATKLCELTAYSTTCDIRRLEELVRANLAGNIPEVPEGERIPNMHLPTDRSSLHTVEHRRRVNR